MIDLNKQNFEIPDTFFDLSKQIYQDKPFFQDNKTEFSLLFSELNPYFNNSHAAYRVLENKARVIVFFDESKSYNGQSVAYFGYWESMNEKELNKELFSECETWAKEKGAKLLIGPVNFNTYNRYRLNTTTNDTKPFFNEPYNPEYYPEILKSCGFEELNSYVSYIVNSDQKLRDWYKVYSAKKDVLSFDDYSFEFITPENWVNNLKEVHQKSEMVFGENFAYTPIHFETFQLRYGEIFARIICPYTSLFIKHKDDGIVGTVINFPNYIDLMKQGKGLLDFSAENYLNNTTEPTLLLKTVGVLKEHTNMGFLLLRAFVEIAPRAIDKYSNYVFCLMQKGNYPSRLGKDFCDELKEYSLYAKQL